MIFQWHRLNPPIYPPGNLPKSVWDPYRMGPPQWWVVWTMISNPHELVREIFLAFLLPLEPRQSSLRGRSMDESPPDFPQFDLPGQLKCSHFLPAKGTSEARDLEVPRGKHNGEQKWLPQARWMVDFLGKMMFFLFLYMVTMWFIHGEYMFFFF